MTSPSATAATVAAAATVAGVPNKGKASKASKTSTVGSWVRTGLLAYYRSSVPSGAVAGTAVVGLVFVLGRCRDLIHTIPDQPSCGLEQVREVGHDEMKKE